MGFIKVILTGISIIVWKEFKSYLKRKSTEIIAELLPFARDVVVEVAESLTGSDNDDKRKEAVKKLREAAREELGDMVDDISERKLNQAVEIAYEELHDYIKNEVEKGE